MSYYGPLGQCPVPGSESAKPSSYFVGLNGEVLICAQSATADVIKIVESINPAQSDFFSPRYLLDTQIEYIYDPNKILKNLSNPKSASGKNLYAPRLTHINPSEPRGPVFLRNLGPEPDWIALGGDPIQFDEERWIGSILADERILIGKFNHAENQRYTILKPATSKILEILVEICTYKGEAKVEDIVNQIMNIKGLKALSAQNQIYEFAKLITQKVIPGIKIIKGDNNEILKFAYSLPNQDILDEIIDKRSAYREQFANVTPCSMPGSSERTALMREQIRTIALGQRDERKTLNERIPKPKKPRQKKPANNEHGNVPSVNDIESTTNNRVTAEKVEDSQMKYLADLRHAAFSGNSVFLTPGRMSTPKLKPSPKPRRSVNSAKFLNQIPKTMI